MVVRLCSSFERQQQWLFRDQGNAGHYLRFAIAWNGLSQWRHGEGDFLSEVPILRKMTRWQNNVMRDGAIVR